MFTRGCEWGDSDRDINPNIVTFLASCRQYYCHACHGPVVSYELGYAHITGPSREMEEASDDGRLHDSKSSAEPHSTITEEVLREK
jgi:hypothetical protein